MSQDETEHFLEQTNARVYWDDLLAVWGTIQVHFAALNSMTLTQRLLPMMTKVLFIQLLTVAQFLKT